MRKLVRERISVHPYLLWAIFLTIPMMVILANIQGDFSNNILAVATVVYAVFTCFIAKLTKDSVMAKILVGLMDDYSKEEMREALAFLWGRKRDLGSDYHSYFSQLYNDRHSTPEFDSWDRKRRIVSQYYIKIDRILKHKLVTQRDMVVVISGEEVETLQEVIIPLNDVIKNMTKTNGYEFKHVISLYKSPGSQKTNDGSRIEWRLKRTKKQFESEKKSIDTEPNHDQIAKTNQPSKPSKLQNEDQ